MNRKDIPQPKAVSAMLEPSAARFDQAIASLAEAEANLRNPRRERLPELVQTMERTAGELRALRSSLVSMQPDGPDRAMLRRRLNEFRHSAGRVNALYCAARKFHEGLVQIHRLETGGYDVRGGAPGCSALHCLEARG